MKKQLQKGFTLIELMIVVAIIGILASIALPAYQDYTVRSRVAELAIMASSMKATISENIANNGGTLAADNCVGVQVISASAATNNTASTSCTPATGVIQATGTAKAGSAVLVYTPTAAQGTPVEWACTTTTAAKFAPAECR